MNELGLFAKYWHAGRVKTRLSRAVGEKPAADVYHAFVTTLVDRLAHTADRRTIVFSPADRAAKFAALGQGAWRITPQSEGGLGDRLGEFFRRSLEEGARRVVVIGSDSPTLPVEYIEQAFQLLQRHEVVLGPSTDGGYYLIGARERVPPVFDGVAWSTPTVWRETIERLDSAGIGHAELPAWYDVDQFDDLRRLNDELASTNTLDAAASRLREVVRRTVSSSDDK
ncbi:MAG: TIGR04282 family arsenosugar biosynthesis glycosyltransferase [Pirellulaceae bacterium]